LEKKQKPSDFSDLSFIFGFLIGFLFKIKILNENTINQVFKFLFF
jgi:hypothetical protein